MIAANDSKVKTPDGPHRQRGRGWLFVGQVTLGLVLLLLFTCSYLEIDAEYFLPQPGPVNRSASDAGHDKTQKKKKTKLAVEKAAEGLAGQLPSFHAESTHMKISGMPCELAVLDATEVEFNVTEVLNGEEVRIKSFGSASLSLRITASDLKSHFIPMLEKKGLKDAHIDFGTGTVKVTGKRKVKLIGRVKISAKGEFYTFNGNGIGLKLKEIESGQLNIGVSGLDYSVEETIPPLDLGGVYANVVIDRLSITGSHLAVSAHAVMLPPERVPGNAMEVF